MTKIEIAIAYHKNSELIKNDCLLPIQVGKACSDIELNMQGDNTGDNISEKNFGYAELTAIYWLWKNSNADIKGLFHYRRFLDLNTNHSNAENWYEYDNDADSALISDHTIIDEKCGSEDDFYSYATIRHKFDPKDSMYTAICWATLCQ